MRDIAPSTGRPTLDKPRSRRDAAKVLGVALQTRYRKLLSATGENEVVVATADLAQCMYENVEFVIWALKHLGGMNPPPPEELRRVTAPQPQRRMMIRASANRRNRCWRPTWNCPARVHRSSRGLAGIIGRERHMTSCPKFVP
jgi:hypothetical protein